jgi:hypothetical protein
VALGCAGMMVGSGAQRNSCSDPRRVHDSRLHCSSSMHQNYCHLPGRLLPGSNQPGPAQHCCCPGKLVQVLLQQLLVQEKL